MATSLQNTNKSNRIWQNIFYLHPRENLNCIRSKPMNSQPINHSIPNRHMITHHTIKNLPRNINPTTLGIHINQCSIQYIIQFNPFLNHQTMHPLGITKSTKARTPGNHRSKSKPMFGRAGLLEEAYYMIKEMQMEPDVVIWRSLLSACRIHGKKELGEFAIANISRLESGDFVLLSNMYCSLKNWHSAERVRHMMKMGGVRKKRGKSWIELGNKIHQFNAADQSHAEMKAIYRVLEGLVLRAKLEGFTPLTDLVLMDVSEEEKEENLTFHSEKLALAYGVLKSGPGTKISISKNLRICQDCHNWIKIVSRILNREIIVRDRIRFHRFEDGFCSCGDYW